MFDFAPTSDFHNSGTQVLNSESLTCLLSTLSDRELEGLEDELDFCNFTGVPSPRILSLLEGVTELDETWQNLLGRWKTPDVPAAF